MRRFERVGGLYQEFHMRLPSRSFHSRVARALSPVGGIAEQSLFLNVVDVSARRSVYAGQRGDVNGYAGPLRIGR